MTTTPDVDAIAEQVRAEPTGPNLARLWQAVYGLPHWWLLPTGSVDDPRPMVGVVGEQRFLLAFTSTERVSGFVGAPSDTAAMVITPADLTDLAPALAREGVAGILFDRGTNDLVAPITGLQSMWGRFGAA